MKKETKQSSIFAFARRFPNEEACLAFLSECKWQEGFKCKKCGHKKYCQGRKKWNRQCTSCRYEESPTAGGLFHRVKFSLRKAFWIIYYVSTMKRNMSTAEMSRKLNMNEKTCLRFRHKVMQAMSMEGNEKISGFIEMLPIRVQRRTLRRDRLGDKKGSEKKKSQRRRQIVMAIERSQGGVCRVKAERLPNFSKTEITRFMKSRIEEGSRVVTNKWTGIPALEEGYTIVKKKEREKGFYFLRRTSFAMEEWLKGVHGGVTMLQSYMDEYCYRFNKRDKGGEIFDDLVHLMIQHPPCPYEKLRKLKRAA